MAREIKFRAWDKDAKRMHYFPNQEFGVSEGDWFITFTGEVFERHGGSGGDFLVENIVLMQFTGLKDDAEKEIYEGDIIQFLNGERVAVEWNDDTCQFQFSDGSPINDGERYATHKRIVGNIYENAELLPPQKV